jgi:hypothetical protein
MVKICDHRSWGKAWAHHRDSVLERLGWKLMTSALEGHLDVVKSLLEAGGRELVMLTENTGFSCLHFSALEGHLDVVKALLEAGGRELMMLTAYDGVSCLMASAHGGHLDMVKVLLEAGGHELVMLVC